MKLQTKLITSQVALSVIPVVVVTGGALWQTTAAFEHAARETQAGFDENTAMPAKPLRPRR